MKEGDKVIGSLRLQMESCIPMLYTEAIARLPVAEKAGNRENVLTIRQSTVTVEVADNGQGKLVSTITGNK